MFDKEQEMITEFRGEHRFLSNFYECPITYNGYRFLNAEAAFQAQKQPNAAGHFSKLSAQDAKRDGKKVILRPDWEQVKDSIMLDIIRAKFYTNPDLKQKLIDTGDAMLIEGNKWHDNYWGVCTCSNCALRVHSNKLGSIIMQVRNECKQGIVPPIKHT